jgi:hypothetical protein
MTKPEIIEQSIHCFEYGLLSLIPGIGIVFNFQCWRLAETINKEEAGAWNPAKQYRVWGVALSYFSIGLYLTCFAWILFKVVWFFVGPDVESGVHGL